MRQIPFCSCPFCRLLHFNGLAAVDQAHCGQALANSCCKNFCCHARLLVSSAANEMIDDGDSCKGQPSCSLAEQTAAAWESSSTIKQPQLKRLPEFGVWQAGQLLVRDIIFGNFLLLTFFLYLRATVPELCKIGPLPSSNTNSSTWSSCAPSPQSDQWPSALKFICGHRTNGSAGSMQNQTLGSWFIRHLNSDRSRGVSVARSSSSWGNAHSAAATPAKSQQSVAVLPLRILGFPLAALAAVVSKVVGVSLYVVQMLYAFFACGFLTKDPFHMIIPPMRLALVMLMLLPLPYPNLARLLRRGRNQSGPEQQQQQVEDTSCQASKRSCRTQKHSTTSYIAWYRPSFWWQHPRFRTANIVVQRLLPPIVAAASVGHIEERYFELTALRYWPVMGQYMYLGWMAWMLVVPLKVHVVVNFAEWLIIYSTAVRVRMEYYNSPLFCTTHLTHLLASLLFVLVLPTAGVAWLERGHKAGYQQALRQLGTCGSTADIVADSSKPAAHQQQQQDSPKSSKQQGSKQLSVEGPAAIDAAISPAADKLLKHGSLIRRRVHQMQHQLNGITSNASSKGAHGLPKAAVVAASPATRAAADAVDSTAAAAGCSEGVGKSLTVPPASAVAPAVASTPPGNGKRRASTNSMPASANSTPSSRRFSVGANHGAAVTDQLLADINSSLQLAARAKQQAKSSSNGTSSKVPLTIDQFMHHKAPPVAAVAAEDVPPARYQRYRSALTSSTPLPAVPIGEETVVASTAAACSPAPAAEYAIPSAASVAPSASVEVQSAAAIASSCAKLAPSLFIVPELAPVITSLIGDEQAAAVFAAAAASAAAHGGPHPAVMPYYTSRAPKQSWNVGLQLV